MQIVPASVLRSTDINGIVISGLQARYSGEGKNFTVYGEGPIDHGWFKRYEGQTSERWAGQFDANWGIFSETLTGQIFIGSCGQ